MHLTPVAQFVAAGSWRSIHAQCWSFAIGSRTRRHAATILSGCGGRKDFAARYVVGRITGLRSGACVTAEKAYPVDSGSATCCGLNERIRSVAGTTIDGQRAFAFAISGS